MTATTKTTVTEMMTPMMIRTMSTPRQMMQDQMMSMQVEKQG